MVVALYFQPHSGGLFACMLPRGQGEQTSLGLVL